MTVRSGPPRIVLATDSRIPSGVGEHMLTLARQLRPVWEVVLAFAGEGEGPEFLARGRENGFEVKRLREGGEDALSAWLCRTRADLLHVQAGIGWEGHGLAEAGQAAGVPVVRTEHLPDLITDKHQRRFYRAGIARVECVICVSEAATTSFAAPGAAVRLMTVRNGIDRPIAYLDRPSTRRSLRIDEGAPVLITVARFTPQKGYPDLLDAMSEIVDWIPDAHLLLVGDGPDRRNAQQRAEDLGIRSNVHFLGSRRDVPDLLAASDIFVLPSHFEGLPLVVLEAMATTLPVVATRIGGTIEALGPDYPWLATPGMPTELAARIEEVLVQPEAARRIGLANRQRFEAEFTADRMARETAEIYHRILASRTGEVRRYG